MSFVQSIADTLKTVFGHNTFRPHQEAIVSHILNGRDVTAILPTGSGKSLCYQLPAVMSSGLTVVVSPLIALMEDQVLQLQKLDVQAACLTSAQTTEERLRVIRHLNTLKLLYVSPERICDPGFLDLLGQIKVSHIVVDEAHCISQWGHAFRPEYRQLSCLKARFSGVPIAAFTATATEDVIQDICRQLALENPVIEQGGFDRPNLKIRVSERHQAKDQLMELMARYSNESGIVYVGTRNGVDNLYTFLKQQGISVAKYHAGLTDVERQRAQHAFVHDDARVMVATLAFGMGINKPNVRFVCHMDMPKNMEQYYQEIGRAGRDGLPAECLLLYSIRDAIMQKQRSAEITDDGIRLHQERKTAQMLAYCQTVECRRHPLLRYFGETYDGDCENCDTCLEPAEWIDGLEIAQKILSCIYRVNQSFGIGHVTDVLIGANTAAIRDRRHDQLSTYSLLNPYSKGEIRSFIYELVNQGFAVVSEGKYPVLKLTAQAKDILFEGKPIRFRMPKPKPKKVSPKADKKQAETLPKNDLFEALRTLRKQIADTQGVPPYVIFHDKTLLEMAHIKPKTESEFLTVSGVGPAKLKQYGAPFIQEIVDFKGAS